MRFQELLKAIFKLFCTKRSSRNRYFICFAKKGTPETIFQFVLNKKELLKLIFRMVCTFRSSFHHKTKCFAQKGASETDIHFWFVLSGVPETDIWFWFALSGVPETDIHFFSPAFEQFRNCKGEFPPALLCVRNQKRDF